MINYISDVVLEVTVDDRSSLQLELDRAVEFALKHAFESRRGVLVTRHGFTFYTVAVSQDVPFGETRERTVWRDLS
ncbi:MAG TPA: hypothetical protein VJQ60_12590 [Arthrobacter sp.]|nr:hypothetical protein [Arthrobacter sp.]